MSKPWASEDHVRVVPIGSNHVRMNCLKCRNKKHIVGEFWWAVYEVGTIVGTLQCLEFWEQHRSCQ